MENAIEVPKRLEDLTFEEIINIPKDSKEYLRLIDLECAHTGARLLPPNPGLKPTVSEHEGDVQLYSVGNWWFESRENAEAIVDLIERFQPCDREYKVGKKIIFRLNPNSYKWPKIEVEKCFSKAKFQKTENEIKAANALTETWEDRIKDFNDAVKDRQEVIKSFDIKLQYAFEVTQNISRILVNFNRYIDLAQGQYEVAINFLMDANKNGSIESEYNDIYYLCSNGKKHLVISREAYRNSKMNELLEVTENDNEKISAMS